MKRGETTRDSWVRIAFATGLFVTWIILGDRSSGVEHGQLAAPTRSRSESHGNFTNRGRLFFLKAWKEEEGLGPEFNARSCHGCHAMPSAGGVSADASSMVHLSPDVRDPTGGHVLRQFLLNSTGRITSRIPPAHSVLRKASSLFGIGQLEAVPETVLRKYADPHDRDGNGVSGRVAQLQRGVGRFGWKGKFATVDDAVAAALVNELGLTTTRHPSDRVPNPRTGSNVEVDDRALLALTEFVRSLSPLAPGRVKAEIADAGAKLFDVVGCAACHRPTLHFDAPARGGGNARQFVHAYTDLLLHDMGPALADGLAEGDASPQEFRTPPLWGISRTGPPYLHDGRAATLDAAIVAHGGEGESSTHRYKALSESDRNVLLAFLASR